MRIRIIIKYILLFNFLSNTSPLKSQTSIIFDEAPGRLRADAGPDIYAPSFSTIMLDASRSVHARGSLLRYEWFLPPSLAYYDDYNYTHPSLNFQFSSRANSINLLFGKA